LAATIRQTILIGHGRNRRQSRGLIGTTVTTAVHNSMSAHREKMMNRLLRAWDGYMDLVSRCRGRLWSGNRNVRIGRGCRIRRTSIESGATIMDYVRLIGVPRINIGRDVYINSFCMLCGEITMHEHSMLSQYVTIWGRAHQYMRRDQLIWDQHGEHGVTDQGYDVQPVVIKRGAWIGPHVTIFRGVTIGEGAVIGAGAVVTKDVPDFAVCFGIPAKVVKYRE
jgi:acetyltransferase-like isoleucine patch superfamily enzyme